MKTAEARAYEAILKTVSAWPPNKRLKLVQDILASLGGDLDPSEREALRSALELLAANKMAPSPGETPGVTTQGPYDTEIARTERPVLERQAALGLLWGLLASHRPAPSDAEIERWLEERRLQRYS